MQDTLAEIEERGEAVRELEKSLLDPNSVFLDMADTVDTSPKTAVLSALQWRALT